MVMKTRTFIFAVLLGAVMATVSCKEQAGQHDRGGMTWYSYTDGFKLARSQKKPVVMFFYADWCRYCKLMDSTTYSDVSIVKKLKDSFVSIRVDTTSENGIIRMDNRDVPVSDMLMRFGVTGMPTTLFFDRNGDLVTGIPGYIEKEVFTPLLGYLQDECYLKKVSFEDYKNGKTACGGTKKK